MRDKSTKDKTTELIIQNRHRKRQTTKEKAGNKNQQEDSKITWYVYNCT